MNDEGSKSGSNSSSSLVNNLKTEWSLFWNSLSGDFVESESEAHLQDPFKTGKIQALSLEQIRDITKALSKNRRQVNQKIESLNKEIELNSVKLDSVRLMGIEDDQIIFRINELSDQGHLLTQELTKIDERLKLVHHTEEEILKNNQPA